MNRGPNIFDFLEERKISYHVSAPEKTEPENLNALISDIRRENIDFAFLYWPGLDGLLHSVGNQSPQVPEKLRDYEKWIREAARGGAKNIMRKCGCIFSAITAWRIAMSCWT